ncbi:MAG: Uncharacterized protein XD65_0625 [Caldanaerobacter subterraneus]|jgi:uncharacterized protein (DUF952 family)|nr:MAG: hypothetical protein XD37_1768 [Thermoanaerobacter thermocopriae]KUK35037.1 MAG: Uncharacterized protein XD65_0625 [Caldanaerobacter subterraneus]
MIILHIAKREDWEEGLVKGEYSPGSLSFFSSSRRRRT